MSENKQFSEFEVKRSTVKFGSAAAMPLGCVGALEETLNVKTVTKKCEGVVKKSKTRGDGTGEIKYTVHANWAAFCKMYGLQTKGLKAGVYAYGDSSVHEEFCYTAETLNEDGDIKYIAYPRCCVNSARASKIENGAEEVSEIEVTAAIMPDEYGFGKYEAFAADLDEATANSWLESFSRALVADLDTFNAVFSVSPIDIGAKATVIDNTGKMYGTYEAEETTGKITVRGLENGSYKAMFYADGYASCVEDFEINNINVTRAIEMPVKG